MGQRRKFSAEYKREAVATRNAPCVSATRRNWRLRRVCGDGGGENCARGRTRRFQATDAHAMRNWPTC